MMLMKVQRTPHQFKIFIPAQKPISSDAPDSNQNQGKHRRNTQNIRHNLCHPRLTSSSLVILRDAAIRPAKTFDPFHSFIFLDLS